MGCQFCPRVGLDMIGCVKERYCIRLVEKSEMVSEREEHPDGGGHLTQGHQEIEHHPHPGADRAGQIVGKRYAVLKIVQTLV